MDLTSQRACAFYLFIFINLFYYFLFDIFLYSWKVLNRKCKACILLSSWTGISNRLQDKSTVSSRELDSNGKKGEVELRIGEQDDEKG